MTIKTRGVRYMWWFYCKKQENADTIIYLYGKETKSVSGELM
jgi:hypothetical protein